MNERLCYVDGSFAYFTTADLDKQWGDDWNDAPYEHNAGEPYVWRPDMGMPRYEIRKVAFDGPLDAAGVDCLNSPYSVEAINSGAVPWLRTSIYLSSPPVSITAGVNIPEFIRLVNAGGGRAYVQAEGQS